MRKYLVLLGLLSIVSNTVASVCAYQKYCPNGTRHVLCAKRNLDSFDEKCGEKYHLYGIDGSLREDVLFRLNFARNMVASGLFDYPPAANMPTLQWDEFLVNTAEKLAFTCDTSGQYCSNSKAYNFVSTVQIGAHFVRDVRQKTAVKDLLNIWIRDLFGCSMDTNGIITRKAVKNTTCLGHYAPLLEDRCNRIGCVTTATFNEAGETTSANLICNLNRANVNDAVPYKISPVPAIGCIQERDYIYEFLCQPSKQVDNNFIPRRRNLSNIFKSNVSEPFIKDIIKEN
ncbi:PREDICTED: venom allergen 3 [Drosophila arizonae]|uniref:Venom allergen 3 n=1 Tax=Drosophila arizonae TaxID=7263 RepID=A0ABM1PCN2_DROAR|nr:PREDICTED: venom allergen 3 [Drosophila arizonae]